MPANNEDAYREMYEMGQRLMEMAKAGGYSPDSEESPMPSDAGEEMSSSEDKVSTALSFYNKE